MSSLSLSPPPSPSDENSAPLQLTIAIKILPWAAAVRAADISGEINVRYVRRYEREKRGNEEAKISFPRAINEVCFNAPGFRSKGREPTGVSGLRGCRAASRGSDGPRNIKRLLSASGALITPVVFIDLMRYYAQIALNDSPSIR